MIELWATINVIEELLGIGVCIILVSAAITVFVREIMRKKR